MKKLIVLVAALLLVSVVAMADTTVNGVLDYRAKNDSKDEVFSNYGVVELKINAAIDDNTSAYVELEEGPKTTGYDTGGFGLDKAHFTVNAGAALDLPVGVAITAGFNEFKVKDGIKVTKGEYEDWIGIAMDAWGYQIEVMPVADMDVTLRATFTGDWDTEGMLIGAYGTIDPVTFEVGYLVPTGASTDAGVIEAGAEFGMEACPGMLGVAATMDYYMTTSLTWSSVLVLISPCRTDWSGSELRCVAPQTTPSVAWPFISLPLHLRLRVWKLSCPSVWPWRMLLLLTPRLNSPLKAVSTVWTLVSATRSLVQRSTRGT